MQTVAAEAGNIGFAISTSIDKLKHVVDELIDKFEVSLHFPGQLLTITYCCKGCPLTHSIDEALTSFGCSQLHHAEPANCSPL